jgi:di/tricarboxylate transporter
MVAAPERPAHRSREGVGLAEAAGYYRAVLAERGFSWTVDEAAAAWQASRERKNRSELDLTDAEERLKRFRDAFGHRNLADVTTAEVPRRAGIREPQVGTRPVGVETPSRGSEGLALPRAACHAAELRMEIAIVLLLLTVAVVLFSREVLPVDQVTWMVLIALVATGILTPEEAFRGFASEILIILASVFVIGAGLRETGLVDVLGEKIQRFGGGNPKRFLAMMMGGTSAMSAFMNNTTVTEVLVPPVIGAAKQLKVSPSQFLMPLAFASILGGTCTLIGTSTNVAVSGYLERVGLEPIGFFEFAPIGAVIVVVGILYMVFIGSRFLPETDDTASLVERYSLRKYLSEITVREGSPIAGQALVESGFASLDLRVLQVLRGESRIAPSPGLKLAGGDVLLVNGPVESLMKVREVEGIDIRAESQLSDEDLRGADLEILEVLISPPSGFLGRTIEELHLPARYGITVLAINRHGQHLRDQIRRIRLKTGDVLLVQGSRERTQALRERPDFGVLSEVPPATHRARRGLIVFGFLLAAVVVSSLGLAPLAISMLAAALGVVFVRAVPPHRVYQSIEWPLLVLIAGMTALGSAMEKTGAAQLLASGIVHGLSPMGVVPVLAGFALLAVVLTQPLSNAAAALVVLPVAIQSAQLLDVNPRSFAIAVALSASVSLIAPLEPASLLVYGPGKYRFSDFVRTGGLLTLILILAVVGLVPVFWPL